MPFVQAAEEKPGEPITHAKKQGGGNQEQKRNKRVIPRCSKGGKEKNLRVFEVLKRGTTGRSDNFTSTMVDSRASAVEAMVGIARANAFEVMFQVKGVLSSKMLGTQKFPLHSCSAVAMT